MRILFAGQSLHQPLGGGELSAATLLADLARAHQVRVIGAGTVARRGETGRQIPFIDYPVRRLPLPLPLAMLAREASFRRPLEREIGQFDPQLLLFQQPAALDPGSLRPDAKLVLFVRSLSCFGIGDPLPSAAGRVARAPFQRWRFGRHKPLLRRADLVLANSVFMQQEIARRTGIQSEVVYPFVDSGRFSGRGSGNSPRGGTAGALTFVGLDRWKGAAVMLEVARRLGERRFLFLVGARSSPSLLRSARALANVTVLPWTRDMASVFAQTRLLLVPSLWQEPFGRLPVEAGSCGIPTLASDCGGLPESVGAGGLLVRDRISVDAWIDAIRKLDDPARYQALSAAARDHAESLDAKVMLGRFRELLASRIGVEL